MLDAAYDVPSLQILTDCGTWLDCRHLRIPANRVTAVIGAGHTGKRALLQTLAGQHGPCPGTLFGMPLQPHRQTRPLAWLAQDDAADSTLRVADYVMQARRRHLGWFRRPDAMDQEAVSMALRTLELQPLAHTRVDSLSASERQRAMLARAMAQAAPVVLLEEPVSQLDHYHRHIVMRWLARQALTGRTIIMTLDDPALAANHAHWLLWMQDGRMLAQGTPQQLLQPAMPHPPVTIASTTSDGQPPYGGLAA